MPDISHTQLMDLQEPDDDLHWCTADYDNPEWDYYDILECAENIGAKLFLNQDYDEAYLEALRLTDPCGGRFCSECEIGGCEGPVNFA